MDIRRIFTGFTLVIYTTAWLFAPAPVSFAAYAEQNRQVQDPQEPANTVGEPVQVFLPLLFTNAVVSDPTPSPAPPSGGPNGPLNSVFGLNLYDRTVSLEDISQKEINWVRPDPLLWSSVEPRRGERNWDVQPGLDEQLMLAAKAGVEPVVIVTGTPGWAQKFQGSRCGPIKEEELDSFARFMGDLVSHYSQPPFAVHYWELWNEPDVVPSASASNAFGCWGNSNDPYYGGGYYAEMLKAVYPAVKAANPAAQVLVGGLLLGCDPRAPEPCGSGRFLEGILRGGGAASFDGVAFHAFDGYAGVLGLYGNAYWGTAWNTTGPALVKKAEMLTEVLASYGAADKYLIATEAALTHRSEVCDEDCEMTKAYYVPQLYAATLVKGIQSTLWYCLNCNWRFVDLVDSSGQPLPAYQAYLAAWKELSYARYIRQVELRENVRIYEFLRGDRLVWTVWALEQGDQVIQLPGKPSAAFDLFGTPIPVGGSSLSATLAPVYLEW